jgi:pyridoxine kinase
VHTVSTEFISGIEIKFVPLLFRIPLDLHYLCIREVETVCTPSLQKIENMTKRQILLINDMAGYGKVATAAMLPVLSFMGLPVCNLPTALVSNTLDYGKFSILDTTDYITSVFPVWRQLGFSFGAVATGFIASPRQAQVVADYCREQSALGALIFVDPIMGDDGSLYNGVAPDIIASLRTMIGVAHLVFPNYTEAAYLTGSEYKAGGVTRAEAREVTDRLLALGARSVLITSITIDGQSAVAGYARGGGYFILPYAEIPVHFPGTGDIFSAVVIGHILRGDPLQQSAACAIRTLSRLIELNRDNPDKTAGIPLERFLGEIR